MATIANLAVQLTANADGFIGGMQRMATATATATRSAGGMLTGFASRVNSTASAMATSLASGDIFGVLRLGIQTTTAAVQALVSKIPYIGPAMAAAAGVAGAALEGLLGWIQKVHGWFQEGAQRIVSMRSAAVQLGVSVSDMGGLALIAGGDVEHMSRGLLHANKTIQDAIASGKGAAGVFAKIGVSAESLASMKGMDRLRAMFEGIRKLEGASQVAGATFELFGERVGHAMLTKIAAGAAGLDAAAAAAARFGHTINDVDADTVLQASRAMKQIGMAVDGLKMNLAVGLAPLILEVSKLFTNLGVDAKQVQDQSLAGAKVLAQVGALAVDAWGGMVIVFKKIQSVFQIMIYKMMEGLKAFFDLMAELPEDAGGGIFGELSKDLGREMQVNLKQAHALIKDIEQREKATSAWDKVNDFFHRVGQRAEEQKKTASQQPQPALAEPKLAGAAIAGSQEAYKSVGEFAAGESSSMAQKQLDSSMKIQDLLKKGELTRQELKQAIKRGLVKKGKI